MVSNQDVASWPHSHSGSRGDSASRGTSWISAIWLDDSPHSRAVRVSSFLSGCGFFLPAKRFVHFDQLPVR